MSDLADAPDRTHRNRWWSWLSILAVALAASAGCGLVNDDDSAEPAAPSATGGATADAAEVFDALADGLPVLAEQVSAAVVAVETPIGEGSGVVWSGDGTIVTNAHVVGDAPTAVVLLADGRRLDASVVATDPFTDLAVLDVDADGLPALAVLDDLVAVGTPVLAVGNPLGFENSVTFGVVSGANRSLPAAIAGPALVDLLQTDAAISPGNSGGALVDLDGRLVGINVAFVPPTAQAVSLGLAIPSPTVAAVVEQLLATGEVQHAYLGVGLEMLTPVIADRLNTAVDRGAIVTSVEPGGPAETAGLEQGDIIAEAGGDTVEGVGDLLGALRRSAPGDELELSVVRAGERVAIDAELGERPS
ncbi:MAG: S1C family serine protease [Acidimicrobiales bacterium]